MLGIQIKLVEKWTYLLRLCKIKREKKTVSHQKKRVFHVKHPQYLREFRRNYFLFPFF